MFVYHPALWAPLLPGGGELKLLSSFDTPSFFILDGEWIRGRGGIDGRVSINLSLYRPLLYNKIRPMR